MLVVTLSCTVYAAQLPSNITPQQIEQFKRLPETQQRALAQSMGIDFNMIQMQLNGGGGFGPKASGPEDQEIYPRGTEFDEFGNPIMDFSMFGEEEEEEDDGKPKPFGYDIFANAPQTFAPIMDIAAPDNYVIGPGDGITVQIFGKENEQHSSYVSRQGQLSIPQLGAFQVSGLSYQELKDLLTNQIKNRVLGVDVVITLAELRSIRVFVAGDAHKPGPYILSALSSMTHALFAAGGINDNGSLRKIQLKRAGKLVSTLDLYDLLINGDSSADAMLKSGDVVFIAPVGDRVTVDGEVNRPAIYELNENESFGAVIKMAGGLLPSAYPSSTVVERFNKNNLRTIVNVDLTNENQLDKTVFAGDVVRVLKTSEQFDESVTIIGAISRPGKYQWSKGQRVSDLFPAIHSYVLEDADLNYSLIVREKDIGRNIEIIQFGLFNAISDPESDDNVQLQPHDKLLVFSMNEKQSTDVETLDSLAMTQEDYLLSEKEKAKLDYEDRMFWLEFGEYQEPEVIDEENESLRLAEKSMEELIGGTYKEKTTAEDLGLYSRQRMLAPVIKKLQNQAAAGQPIQLVEVVGAVKYPGIYPLAKNNKVVSLLHASGGLLESAYLRKAEITRNQVFDAKARKESIDVNLKDALANNPDQNITLQSKDRLNVHVIPSWQENHIVELRGEFLFPGKYTIQRGETLSQLIERAGGYTEFAYTQGSVFSREKLKQLELQNILKISESLRMEIASKSLSTQKGMDYNLINKLLNDLTRVTPVGRLVINLEDVQSSADHDIFLENGDILYVPTKNNAVNVIGQVQVATSHVFDDKLSAHDYVTLSGGTRQQADTDRIYIIKANGRVEIPQASNWFISDEQLELNPGDTVVVPLDSEYVDDLKLWATATQIVYQAAIAIAAIGSI
jgi:polysaccharide biosynthesis/export protein